MSHNSISHIENALSALYSLTPRYIWQSLMEVVLFRHVLICWLYHVTQLLLGVRFIRRAVIVSPHADHTCIANIGKLGGTQ